MYLSGDHSLQGNMMRTGRLDTRWEHWIKWFITARGRKTFICERPWICVACVRLRDLIKRRRLSPIIFMPFNSGAYIFNEFVRR